MKNQNKTIIAGLMVMAAMLSVSITYNTAFAQELDVAPQAIDKPNRPHTVLVGTGAAVSEDDHGWRSYFRMGIVSESQTTDVDADVEYKIKRGKFIVGSHENRHVYQVVPDTWIISVSPDKETFDATGTVENKNGKVFDVMITGKKISDLQRGNLYSVTGFASNADGEMFDLFYISAMFDRTHSIRPPL